MRWRSGAHGFNELPIGGQQTFKLIIYLLKMCCTVSSRSACVIIRLGLVHRREDFKLFFARQLGAAIAVGLVLDVMHEFVEVGHGGEFPP